MSRNPGSIVKRIIGWFLGVIGFILLLILVLMVILQTRWGQDEIKAQAVKYLEKKLKTKVSIDQVTISWLTHIQVRGIYLEDVQQRKLLSVKQLDLTYVAADLFRRQIVLPDIKISNPEIQLFRAANDSQFNFSFITAAFAGKEKRQPADPSKPFIIKPGNIQISGLSFLMDDQYGGSYYKASWNSLQSEITRFNLASMDFGIRQLLTDSIDCRIRLFAGTAIKKEKTDAASPLQLTINADSLQLLHTVFQLENTETKMLIASDAKLLGGSNIRYDQQQLDVTAGYLTLQEHATTVNMISSKKTAAKESSSAEVSKPFTWAADELYIDKNKIAYNDNAYPKQRSGEMDFRHLELDNITIAAHKPKYDGARYMADIKNLRFVERSGFRMEDFHTNGIFSDSGVSLKNLYVQTKENHIEGNLAVSYSAVSQITSHPQFTKIDADLNDTRLSLRELLYFSPSLERNKSFRPLISKRFFISTSIHGTLNKLHIPNIFVKENNTSFHASADVLNLPDTKKLIIDLNLKGFSSTRSELLAFLPANTIPDSLLHYIPERFSLMGKYRGSLANLYTDLALRSSAGNVKIKGTLRNITDKHKAEYDLVVNTDTLQLGKLLNDTLFGSTTATIVIVGYGLDLHTATASVNATIKSAKYKNYQYHGIELKGNLKNELLEAHVISTDPEIQLQSDVLYNLNKTYGSFKTTTHIGYVNLMKLGFVTDTLVIAGTDISADIPELDSAHLNGSALISGLQITYNNKHVTLDTIQLKAKHDSIQSIVLTSPFGEISLKGKYDIDAIVPAVKTVTNKYLYTQSSDTLFTKSLTAELKADIDIPDSLIFLVQGLKSISPLSATAFVNTDSSLVAFNLSTDKIEYGDFTVDSLSMVALNLPSSEEYKTMVYKIVVGRIKSSSLDLNYSLLDGTINHGRINGTVSLFDDKKDPRYVIPYKIVNDPAIPYLQIGDSLVLDRKKWTVNKENLIYFNANALKGTNFQLRRNDELLSIFADSSNITGLPLTLQLTNFRVENITHIISSDSGFIEGVANGKVHLQRLAPFLLTGDMTIDSLKLKEVNAGNLKIDIKEASGEQMIAEVVLKGSDNDVMLDGMYNPETKAATLHLDIKKFDLRNAEPFTSAYLGSLSGSLKGEVNLNGTIAEPNIGGVLHADSIHAIYKAYGTEISIPVADFSVDGEGVKFDQLVFTDSAGHKGKITGSFSTHNFNNYSYDIKVVADSFLAIGRKRYPDQIMYGPTSVNINVNITGNETKMSLNGAVNVSEKSQFTYIYSPNESSSRGDGLIEFFDPAKPVDSSALVQLEKKIKRKMEIAMNVYVTITPSSTITIVLDELSGDHLKINGTAGLNYTMNPGGEMSLVGNYTVESGDYDLSIASIIRKKFSIQKGSTITWSGDPLKADMNITALYTTKTSAGELVQDVQSVPGIDKQQLNFQVYLILTKELLKPDIQFRLDMPVNEQTVFDGIIYTRLKQVNSIPSELNKQVMGLLAINHFIADNPFSSLTAGNSSFETKAFTTAGRLLTDELNELLGKAIKGVDINFELNVDEDYTSGRAQRNTNLKIGLTRSLVNNRLSVYVGNSFALEGQNQDANVLSGLAGDVRLEYLLSKDGRYRLKGYRLTENELTFQGTIIKTGVTFEIVLEFNKIKNAFKKRGNRKKSTTKAS